jgi:hypothetical protein
MELDWGERFWFQATSGKANRQIRPVERSVGRRRRYFIATPHPELRRYKLTLHAANRTDGQSDQRNDCGDDNYITLRLLAATRETVSRFHVCRTTIYIKPGPYQRFSLQGSQENVKTCFRGEGPAPDSEPSSHKKLLARQNMTNKSLRCSIRSG